MESLKYHPYKVGKNNDTQRRWENLHKVSEYIKRAYEILIYTPESENNDTNTYSRWNYDYQCDILRISWQKSSSYNDQASRQLFEKKVANKRLSSINKAKKLSPIEQCVKLYSMKSQQKNEWRYTIHSAMQYKDASLSLISRKIRAERGTPRWDGRANRDKEYQSIYQKVLQANKSFLTGNINEEMIKKIHIRRRESLIRESIHQCWTQRGEGQITQKNKI